MRYKRTEEEQQKRGDREMKCDYCGKGRPKLWNKDGKFCNESCYQEWLHKLEKSPIYRKLRIKVAKPKESCAWWQAIKNKLSEMSLLDGFTQIDLSCSGCSQFPCDRLHVFTKLAEKHWNERIRRVKHEAE